MLIRPLKRVPVPNSTTAELVEPSAGLASTFITKLQEFARSEDDKISAQYFSAFRILVCMHDGGRPFFPQYVNSLHEANQDQWNLSVSETDSLRQVIDALDGAYCGRIVDNFLDVMNATQMEEWNTIIRTELWATAGESKKS